MTMIPRTKTELVPVLDRTNVELWRAIKRRDYRYDEAFVFGVRSTGIYCRPSCPARTPGRNQVAFFLTPQLAERAGYRACKRCRPNDKGFATLQRTRIEETCSFINQNLDGRLGLAELGKSANLNPFYFQRLFKRIVGLTPRQYVEGVRLRRAKMSMNHGDSVRSSIYKAGRNSTSWLYTNPYAKLGMRPSAYRSKGRNMHNLDEAQKICDKIAILNTKLMAMGTPEELERSVSGRKTVVQLVQMSDAVLVALRKLPLGDMAVDGNTLTVDVKDPDKENVAIMDAIYRAGGHVQSATVVGSTLEDAYLKLVRRENK